MYFWNTKALSENLAAGKISPSEKPKYILFVTCMAAAYAATTLRGFFGFNIWCGLIVGVLLLAGYVTAIRKNQFRDGKDLSLRLLSLSGPLLLKVFAGMLVYWFVANKFFPVKARMVWLLAPSWILFTAIYLKWLIGQIETVSKPKVSWEAHQGI